MYHRERTVELLEERLFGAGVDGNGVILGTWSCLIAELSQPKVFFSAPASFSRRNCSINFVSCVLERGTCSRIGIDREARA